jgi:hypothetical protein
LHDSNYGFGIPENKTLVKVAGTAIESNRAFVAVNSANYNQTARKILRHNTAPRLPSFERRHVRDATAAESSAPM